MINPIESIQYNGALTITSAIRRTSRKKLYNKLGLKFLKGRWVRHLCYFHNFLSTNYLVPLA